MIVLNGVAMALIIKFRFGLQVLAAALINLLPLFSIVAAPNPNEGLGLELSPPIIELTADPGQTFTIPIQLRNITRGDLIAYTRVDDFKAKDEEGNPGIIFNPTETTTYSVRTWIEDLGSFPMAAQSTKSLTAKLNVPLNAEPGGHYGVIRFAVNPASLSSQGVAVGASVGTLVLLRVNGAIKENLTIAEFSVGQAGKTKRLFTKGPFTFTERLKNDGNVHQKPSGYIDIFSSNGKRLTTIPVNNNPVKNVLPDSIRRFEQTYGDKTGDAKLWFGRYRADLNMIYGPNNTPIKATLHFWVMPLKQMALVLLALLILILIYVINRQSKRRRK